MASSEGGKGGGVHPYLPPLRQEVQGRVAEVSAHHRGAQSQGGRAQRGRALPPRQQQQQQQQQEQKGTANVAAGAGKDDGGDEGGDKVTKAEESSASELTPRT